MQSLTYTGHAGGLDFIPHVFPGLTRAEISWRVSDHYPLWVEFELDPEARRDDHDTIPTANPTNNVN